MHPEKGRSTPRQQRKVTELFEAAATTRTTAEIVAVNAKPALVSIPYGIWNALQSNPLRFESIRLKNGVNCRSMDLMLAVATGRSR